MHTILGAGGPISNSLANELIKNGHSIRLVSRSAVTRFPGIEWQGADLKNNKEVQKAVQGSSVIYMCAGLPYNKKVWAAEWPVIMQNLIDAAQTTGARLIFFDNVYMYGHVNGSMNENTPYNPLSVKGEIRAKIARKLMDETLAGNIKASIARAADFYGAESLNSFYDSMVLAKYAKGEKAMWLGNVSKKHAFTYVPDAGKAMYLLGQTPASDSQVWHLPTAKAMTGKAFIELAASTFNRDPRYTTINKFMLHAIGIFNKLTGETAELYYQYKYDYIFDSSKFEDTFGLRPTSYNDGVKELSKTLFKVKA
ncbi:MAG: NAD-dependent epimerase/dehydratase family protein [Chitinophagaceae bacterium]